MASAGGLVRVPYLVAFLCRDRLRPSAVLSSSILDTPAFLSLCSVVPTGLNCALHLFLELHFVGATGAARRDPPII